MHIAKVIIKDIRCFRRLELDLTSLKSVRTWCLLLGDNGVGKTTVLRTIAMGLCDATSAAALQRELYGDWVRRGAKLGEVTIEFNRRTQAGRRYRITTYFKSSRSGYVEIKQRTIPSAFPWDDIFVCGYGAARRSFGTKDYDEYASLDALYTLFNYDSPLQSPELVLRRLHFSAPKTSSKIIRRMESVLLLPENSIRFTHTGLAINGPWGDLTPIGALGDGYQATFAWLTDMIGWSLLYDRKSISRRMTGIILIDEIEQHLHPKWQRLIVGTLARAYPNLQFISTTHSALCASGMGDLPDKDTHQSLLKRTSQGEVEEEELVVPRGLRADQILTSDAFGLETTRDPLTAEKFERFADLTRKAKLSRRESEEATGLKNWLKSNTPEAAESAKEREVQREVRDLLRDLTKISPKNIGGKK